jgi:hypothetical protein
VLDVARPKLRRELASAGCEGMADRARLRRVCQEPRQARLGGRERERACHGSCSAIRETGSLHEPSEPERRPKASTVTERALVQTLA